MRRSVVGLVICVVAMLSQSAAHSDDREIMKKIVDGIATHKANGSLKNFKIGLRVEDGAVFLNGTVADQAQHSLASQTARNAEGVKLVVDDITVEESSTQDREASPAPDRAADRKLTLAELRLKVPKRGDVGPAEATANQHSSRSSAVQVPFIASDEALGKIVTAELESPPGHPNIRTRKLNWDALDEAKEIATQIIQRFKTEETNGNLRGFGIDIEVDHGIVWLEGHVASRRQGKLAVDIVGRVPGVKRVMDDLTVDKAGDTLLSPGKSDDQIAQEIVQLLEERIRAGELRDVRIDFQVEHGVVWMSGQVADSRQREVALDATRFVDGVEKIVDDLIIGPLSSRSELQR